MNERNEFWQRHISETLLVEVVPGEQPGLLIERQGQGIIKIEHSEIRPLIDVLTVALGELYILKDPETISQVKDLLSRDVTLIADGNTPQSVTSSNCVTEQELLKRYEIGDRGFPKVDLRHANLVGADLRGINLFGADLGGASLQGANLQKANLAYANLQGANLNKTDLTDAKVTDEQLAQARRLTGAIMPDGTRHA